MPLVVWRGQDGEPYAIGTKLGWAINGPLDTARRKAMSSSAFIEEITKVRVPDPMLEKALRQFWEMKD